MTDVIGYFLAHPILLGMTASVLSILSLDIDNYITFRTQHPGASYDFVVVFLRLFKGLIAPLILALGAMGYQAVTQ